MNRALHLRKKKNGEAIISVWHSTRSMEDVMKKFGNKDRSENMAKLLSKVSLYKAYIPESIQSANALT